MGLCKVRNNEASRATRKAYLYFFGYKSGAPRAAPGGWAPSAPRQVQKLHPEPCLERGKLEYLAVLALEGYPFRKASLSGML